VCEDQIAMLTGTQIHLENNVYWRSILLIFGCEVYLSILSSLYQLKPRLKDKSKHGPRASSHLDNEDGLHRGKTRYIAENRVWSMSQK